MTPLRGVPASGGCRPPTRSLFAATAKNAGLPRLAERLRRTLYPTGRRLRRQARLSRGGFAGAGGVPHIVRSSS